MSQEPNFMNRTFSERPDRGNKKILFIPYRMLLGLFQRFEVHADYVILPRPVGLPDDYMVTAIHEDFARHAFAFVIQSETFPETPVGEMFPEIELVEWEAVRIVRHKEQKVEYVENLRGLVQNGRFTDACNLFAASHNVPSGDVLDFIKSIVGVVKAGSSSDYDL